VGADPFTATSSSVKDGSRKIGENKLIGRPSVGGSSGSKHRFQVRGILSAMDSAIDYDISHINRSVRTASNLRPRTRRNIVMVKTNFFESHEAIILINISIGCAYKKGLCSICGKQILDTTGYVMSSK
jgi:cysteine-rich PDZ-binding protein